MSVATLIEAAEARRAYDGGDLMVLDGQVHCALRYEDDRFIAYTWDDGGRGNLVSGTQRVETVAKSIDGYLDILNNGI